MTATSQTAIRRGEVYPLELFMKASGLGRHSMRQMRRAGLKVNKIGAKIFVSGDAFHDFLDRTARDIQAQGNSDAR